MSKRFFLLAATAGSINSERYNSGREQLAQPRVGHGLQGRNSTPYGANRQSAMGAWSRSAKGSRWYLADCQTSGAVPLRRLAIDNLPWRFDAGIALRRTTGNAKPHSCGRRRAVTGERNLCACGRIQPRD